MSEFSWIERYLQREGLAARAGENGVVVGIGDDGAVLSPPPGRELVISLDVLVEGVHFPADAEAGEVARKALAVNLSDLAAMGAEPWGFTLGLTLPTADEAWLAEFSEGLLDSAERYRCPLLGGDLSRGPRNIAIQVQGLVDAGQALRRDGAQPGDLVYVTGSLGDAGLGLRVATGHNRELEALSEADREHFLAAFYRPEPRLDFGRRLIGLASAAIDVSDGLMQDLGHIARRSGVAIDLHAEALPLSAELERALPISHALALALGAGEDYELAFCLPPSKREALVDLCRLSGLRCTQVGVVGPGQGLRCLDPDGEVIEGLDAGFQHFREDKA